MLRPVLLPKAAVGALFLGAMPGKYEQLEDSLNAISQQKVTRIVCLAPPDEIARKSPRYSEAIAACSLPCQRDVFEIPDYGVPQDRGQFLAVAERVASGVSRGERVMIHCGAGIGRTGTLAVCILMVLGLSLEDALTLVKQSGSHPESEQQLELIHWMAHQISGGKTDLPSPV